MINRRGNLKDQYFFRVRIHRSSGRLDEDKNYTSFTIAYGGRSVYLESYISNFQTRLFRNV